MTDCRAGNADAFESYHMLALMQTWKPIPSKEYRFSQAKMRLSILLPPPPSSCSTPHTLPSLSIVHEVAGLDVPVDDPLGVDVRQGGEERLEVHRDTGEGEGLHHLPEVVVLEEGHHEGEHAAGGSDNSLRFDHVVATCGRFKPIGHMVYTPGGRGRTEESEPAGPCASMHLIFKCVSGLEGYGML